MPVAAITVGAIVVLAAVLGWVAWADRGSRTGTVAAAGVPATGSTSGAGQQHLSSDTAPDSGTDAALAALGRPVPIAAFVCPVATVEVGTADELASALRAARPGEVIGLKDGVYAGAFVTGASGTAASPVLLCGGRGAVLEGKSLHTGYVLHFDKAAHWRVSGFTVRTAQKGVVVDAGNDIELQNLLVEHIGDEAVHLRRDSSRNVVRGLTIRDTGLSTAEFGEGIYVGTAQSNWPTISGGQPDHSDGNFLLDNIISRATAESIDIKEGTTGGVIAGNSFDGTGMTSARAWVNVKGNNWTISHNRGANSPKDGFQTHVVLDGWGQANLFVGNVSHLGEGQGVGVYVQEALGNRVGCDNTTTGSARASNLTCTP